MTGVFSHSVRKHAPGICAINAAVASMEFAAFLSAVKGKKRTDQYLILSALFFLNAHKSPVTSKDVQNLLSLRLKKNVPKNIPDSLRKYEAYVECVDQGPPLHWS